MTEKRQSTFNVCDVCDIKPNEHGTVALKDMARAIQYLGPLANVFDENASLDSGMQQELHKRFDLSEYEADQAWNCAQKRAAGGCLINK